MKSDKRKYMKRSEENSSNSSWVNIIQVLCNYDKPMEVHFIVNGEVTTNRSCTSIIDLTNMILLLVNE